MRVMILAAVAGLIGLGAWTSYYTVPSDSVAVVQRFGKYLKEVPPGLHFKLPLGIDVATLVPVKRQLKQEFGFGTPGAERPVPDRSQTPAMGGARPRWSPATSTPRSSSGSSSTASPTQSSTCSRSATPSDTLRDVSESVMREVVGDRTVDEVITIGRQEIETEALLKLQALSTKYAHGHQHRPGAAQERQPARAGAGLVQRGQPGAAGEGEADQRGQRRIQQGRSRAPRARRTSGSARPRATD